MKAFSKFLLALLPLLLAACQPAAEHGHSHEAEGGHSHAEAGPRLDYTVWTNQTELFVEFPALVVGKSARFAAHFTQLQGHQPIREGSVTVSLVKDGKGIRHTVDGPSSPGIFGPSLQPKEPGIYQLIFDLNAPQYKDHIVIESVQVFASDVEAGKALGAQEENANAITFLKEQAWKMEFQTAPTVKKEIFQVIQSSGTWKVAPSDYQTLVAPTLGRVTYAAGLLAEGSPVRKGQLLMTVSSSGLPSNNLGSEIAKAKAEFEQAKAEYERKQELFNSQIVPKAELEQVEQRYLVSKTNLETLSNGYSSGGRQVVAPMDGFIKSILIENGGFAEQGKALITITSQSSSLLQVDVSPQYASELGNIQNIWYQTKPGLWSDLKQKEGKIVSVSKVVSPSQPLLSVFAQVNEGVEMPEGSFTEAQIAIGQAKEALVLPELALMEDYGSYSVIVQLSGESFERRNVSIGRRNGSEVEILSGLSEGEVVVVKGAYQVKMASMSGQAPAHGHAH